MFFFLIKFFSWGELIVPTPWRLWFKFEVKPGKSKKSKSRCILKFKMWSRNILENMLRKNCYLKTVTLDLSFISLTLAYESYIPYRGKFSSGKNFVREKISHFSLTNFSNSSLFSDQFLKLKGLSWVGLLFFQRKVVLLVWDFSNWAWRSALLVSLIHGIGCCKYTPSWISQNKKFLYKLIFRNYKIFRRIPGEF